MSLNKRASLFLTLALIILATSLSFNQSQEANKLPVNVESEKEKKDQPYRTMGYDPQGKRDPFKSLIVKPKEPVDPYAVVPGMKVPGIRGMQIHEVKLIGLAKGINGEKIAVLFGIDQKAHFLYEKDRLLDGYVKEIKTDSVTFIKETKYVSGNVRREEVKMLLYPPVAVSN